MQPIDSPTGWVSKHIQLYVESGGAQGHLWNGHYNLLLTTRGRKTGELRRTALIYGKDGDRYIIVGSNGGSAKHPLWYQNLLADPEVTLQVGPDVFTARASTAGPDEKPALWKMMATKFPTYDSYQRKTKREIPVVILQPV